MTRHEWTALAARCEEATRSDDDIDATIHLALGWTLDRLGFENINGSTEITTIACPPEFRGRARDYAKLMEYDLYSCRDTFPSVTESLDCIVALTDRELPGHSWRTGNLPSRRGFALLGTSKAEHVAATPALALCTAFCRAMAERTAT